MAFQITTTCGTTCAKFILQIRLSSVICSPH
ncbi:hypothetical protein L915_10382 [Phytophthora nicotianae]|uniref:Uncharacterized protein n=1 Tax=Phytophthora nicotianae TaxID=4792 RepID=W2GQW0_PHYNI|nr:hypothetical protein L915_10382 [Phytophthora nicotianae]